MSQEPLTISVREACRWLGVGRDEGYRMVADGRLPAAPPLVPPDGGARRPGAWRGR